MQDPKLRARSRRPGALKFRSCLTPAEACYEWQRIWKSKQPESIVLPDGDVVHRIDPTNRVHLESRRDCQTLLSVGFSLLAR